MIVEVLFTLFLYSAQSKIDTFNFFYMKMHVNLLLTCFEEKYSYNWATFIYIYYNAMWLGVVMAKTFNLCLTPTL